MSAKKQRSPSYPGIPLQEAIDRAHQFFRKEGKHEALVQTAVTHWGYSSKSSGGALTIAALKAYGLMADKGAGAERKVFLTPFGLNMIMDERTISPDRDKAIQKAALTPKIMAELWNKYGLELPSHETFRHYLRVEREFNDNAVNDVIKVYQANVQFARLGQDDVGFEESNDGDGDNGVVDPPPPPPTGGNASNVPPARVVQVQSIVPTGGEEIGNYRVSKTTTIRLVATGPYSRQSIEGLVKQLQLGLDLGNFDDLPENDEPA